MMERYFADKQGDTTYVTDGVTRYADRSHTFLLFATIVDIGGCGIPAYDEGSYYNRFKFSNKPEPFNPNNENIENLGEHVSLAAAARHWYG